MAIKKVPGHGLCAQGSVPSSATGLSVLLTSSTSGLHLVSLGTLELSWG